MKYFFCGFLMARVKAGTHWPNRRTSEAFGETRTRSGTNLFSLFSCAGSFQSCVDVVFSDSTCKVWGSWLLTVWAIGFSDWLCASCMTILIGGVLANQRCVWEGRNTVSALFFWMLHSVISCFHVAPPAYCISRKHITYMLLWSWQHIEALCSMQLFCWTGQTRCNKVVG